MDRIGINAIRCREAMGSKSKAQLFEGEWVKMVGAVRFELTTF
jgi:hypothetical protein